MLGNIDIPTHLRIETTDLNATLRNAADSLSDSSVPNIVVGETNRLLSDKNHVFCREDDPSNRACGAFECAPIGFVIHCNVPLDLESFVDAAMAGRSTLNCRPAKARSSTLAVVVARLLWMDQIVTLNFRIEPDPILFARVKEDSEGYRGILVDQWQLYPAARYAAVLLALWVTGVTWGSNIFGSMCRKAVEPLVVDMYQAEGITAAPNSVSLLNLLKRALVALQSPMSLRLPHCDFQMITSDASFSNDLGYLAYCATQSLEALTRPLSDRTVFMFLFPSVQFLPFKSVVCDIRPCSFMAPPQIVHSANSRCVGGVPAIFAVLHAFAAHVLATKTNSNPSQKQIEETLDANFAFLNKHSAGKSDRMLVADEFLTGVSFSNQLMARITIQEYGVEPEMDDRRSGQNAIL